jgi:hypothetical protein
VSSTESAAKAGDTMKEVRRGSLAPVASRCLAKGVLRQECS